MGLGPACWTLHPTGFSEWGLGYISHTQNSSLYHCIFLYLFFKRFYVFLERGRETSMSGRNRNTYWLPLIQPHLRTWPATQTCVLTGNQTSDPAACRTTPSSLSHTSQGASSLSIPLLSITKCLYCCNSLITDLFVSTHIVFLLVPWHC